MGRFVKQNETNKIVDSPFQNENSHLTEVNRMINEIKINFRKMFIFEIQIYSSNGMVVMGHPLNTQSEQT